VLTKALVHYKSALEHGHLRDLCLVSPLGLLGEGPSPSYSSGVPAKITGSTVLNIMAEQFSIMACVLEHLVYSS